MEDEVEKSVRLGLERDREQLKAAFFLLLTARRAFEMLPKFEFNDVGKLDVLAFGFRAAEEACVRHVADLWSRPFDAVQAWVREQTDYWYGSLFQDEYRLTDGMWMRVEESPDYEEDDLPGCVDGDAEPDADDDSDADDE